MRRFFCHTQLFQCLQGFLPVDAKSEQVSQDAVQIKIIFLMKNQVITVYRQTERFAELTKKLIVTGNIVRAKKCLAFAEHLLKTGTAETRNLIAGQYLHSVSSFMEFRGCRIAGLFPKDLQTEYVKQINTSGV